MVLPHRIELWTSPLPREGKDLVGQTVRGLPTKAPTCRTQNGARYVAFLPAGLMSVLPLIFGGGLATALLGLLPNLRSYALIGLAVLLGLAVIYGQTEKANYESEKAGRAADNAAADQAALQQAARDREWRAQIDAQHQADMADLQRRRRPVRLPSATRRRALALCLPAYRAYYDSVRGEQKARPAGGR
jgi:hypothetical protein